MSFEKLTQYRVQVQFIQSFFTFDLELSYREYGLRSLLCYTPKQLRGIGKKAVPTFEQNVCVAFFVVVSVLLSTFFFFTWRQDVTEPVGGRRGELRMPQGKIPVLWEDDDAGPLYSFLFTYLYLKLLVVSVISSLLAFSERRQHKKHIASSCINIHSAIWLAIFVVAIKLKNVANGLCKH